MGLKLIVAGIAYFEGSIRFDWPHASLDEHAFLYDGNAENHLKFSQIEFAKEGRKYCF